jgi:hypothetical protein
MELSYQSLRCALGGLRLPADPEDQLVVIVVGLPILFLGFFCLVFLFGFSSFKNKNFFFRFFGFSFFLFCFSFLKSKHFLFGYFSTLNIFFKKFLNMIF